MSRYSCSSGDSELILKRFSTVFGFIIHFVFLNYRLFDEREKLFGEKTLSLIKVLFEEEQRR